MQTPVWPKKARIKRETHNAVTVKTVSEQEYGGALDEIGSLSAESIAETTKGRFVRRVGSCHPLLSLVGEGKCEPAECVLDWAIQCWESLPRATKSGNEGNPTASSGR